jgi:hypothetical protein
LKIEYIDGLLVASLSLEHNQRSHTIGNIIIDTGAAQSVIDTQVLDILDINPEGDDEIITMAGIGGTEYAVRKMIDRLQFDTVVVERALIDFGNLDGHPRVNGLLGLDILLPGRFIIDLEALTLYHKS